MSKETNEFPKGSIQKETKPNNKRKIVFWSLLASGVGVIIIVALLLIFLLPKEEKYEIELSSNVSVEDEILTGNGSYKKGESITIVAEEITGYRFTGWSFNGNIISTDKEYTFIIGEDTEGEYTANYDKLYSISVEDVHNSVSIMGNKTQAIEDEKVEFTITQNPDYRFISVKVNEDTLIESDGKYIFNMPAEDVTIIVTYAEEYAITIDSSVSDMVTSVSLDKAISGEQVVVTANIQDTVTEDYVIMSDGLYYIENGSEEKVTINQIEGQYSFTMPANDITIGVEKYRRLDDFNFSGNAITGYTGSDTELILPSYYETVSINSQDYTVEKETGTQITALRSQSFRTCSELETVIIPTTLTTIDSDYTFSGTNLKNIYYLGSKEEWFLMNIPQSTSAAKWDMFSNGVKLFIDNQLVTEIEINSDVNSHVFKNYSYLTKVTLNCNVNIGYGAFSGSALKEVVIEENVTSVSGSAFSGCDNLQKVDFGANSQLQTIGDYAFSNCDNLTSITIPASVTSIGYNAFYNCDNLQKVDFGANSQLQTIDNSAFWGCTNLTSITIPASVTSIGDNAFNYCDNLQTVDFGDNSQLQTIGQEAFSYCASLSSITIPESMISTGYGVFYGCDKNFDIHYQGTLDQWLDLTTKNWQQSGANLYINNDQLVEEVTINKNIKDYAFYGITSLKKVIIEEGVTSIGNYAFYNCTNLQTVDFGKNLQLKTIGNFAFWDCRNLTSITIPESVTKIGSSAFKYCYSLAIVYNNSSLDITAGSSDYGSIGEYAYEVVNAGEEAQGSIEKINNVNYYINGTTKVALSMIDRSATTVSLEEDTTVINQRAFYGCENLTSITIPASVTTIGSWTFYGCYSLQTVDFEDNSQLQTIGIFAFYYCTSISSITIPESVTSIGNQAFYDCTNLTSVTIESDDIYVAANGIYSGEAGYLLANATTVKVLKSIDDGSNTYLSSTDRFTLDNTSDPTYNIYTKQ